MCSILWDLPLLVICICIKFPNSFKNSPHNNVCNNLFPMKNHILCSSLCLHVNRACNTVYCSIAMAKNVQEKPWPSQQQLAHNSCWGRHSFHRLLFLFFLVFSGHDMNVFVTDLTVGNVVTHMQGFSSGILIIFFLETVWNGKKSGVICGSRIWLMCTILVYRCGFYTDFRLISLKCLSSQ